MIALDNLESICNTAKSAAERAEADYLARHGEPMYCGFAWVVVREKGNTKMGRALKTVGFKPAYGGGLSLWNPGGSFTQSMVVKEVGAEAYAEVLRQHGIDAYMNSRAD